ncbi:MAG: gamma-glutamyl-gamma-aminobutyrate hydrolase family protein [Deltaproteobacteria bacterium]
MKRHKPVIGITTDIKEGNFLIEEKYARAVAVAGGIPFLIPSITGNDRLVEDTAAAIDGLLLPGSRDMDPGFYNEEPHPKLRPMSLERTETEFAVLRQVTERRIPVLGICGGMQLINVFCGGSLYQDIHSFIPDAGPHEKGAAHEILVESGSLLFRITGTDRFSSKSYHHQAVKETGRGLRVSARAPDGIVECIESLDPPFVLGIQWHPELEDNVISERILNSFIEECIKRL